MPTSKCCSAMLQLIAYVPVLSEHSPIFNSRHGSSSIQIKTRVDLRETTKQFDISVEGQASKVWSKLPQDILRSGQVNGWQSVTKDCQRFLTGKKPKTSLPRPPHGEGRIRISKIPRISLWQRHYQTAIAA